MKNFTQLIESPGDFYRLPENVINNELFMLSSSTKNLYNNAKLGEDFDFIQIKRIKKLLSVIEKSLQKNPVKV